MKAVVQRRLTPVLALLCVIFGVALTALVGGAGRRARWKPALPIEPLPISSIPEAAPVAQPLASMQDIWQRTLFEPSRKQTPLVITEPKLAKLEGITLTGVVRTDTLHVALLQDTSGNAVRVPLDGLYQGWRLVSVELRRVVFVRGTDRTELSFPESSNEVVGARSGSLIGKPSDIVSSAPQSMPMMTNVAPNASPPPDEVAVRRAHMEALKAIVTQRRQASPPSTGSP